MILAGDGPLSTEHVPERFAPTTILNAAPDAPLHAQLLSSVKRGVVAFPVGTTMEQAEKGLIQFTLQHTNNNKSRAARMLGISPKTLHCKLRVIQIRRGPVKPDAPADENESRCRRPYRRSSTPSPAPRPSPLCRPPR